MWEGNTGIRNSCQKRYLLFLTEVLDTKEKFATSIWDVYQESQKNTPKLNSWFTRPSSNLFSFVLPHSPPLHPATQVRILISPSPLHLGYHRILRSLPAIDETPAGLPWGCKKAVGYREEIAPIWPASSHLRCHPQKELRYSCSVCCDSHPLVQRSPSSQLLFDK